MLESQMMEESDSLDISDLILEGAIRAASRGEGMAGMEMLLLPCVGTFLKWKCSWVQARFIGPVGASWDLSWLERFSLERLCG